MYRVPRAFNTTNHMKDHNFVILNRFSVTLNGVLAIPGYYNFVFKKITKNSFLVGISIAFAS